ncbi:MAG: MFS transporter [Candidatus Hydrogenedentes bacterium]|nr:MFS transporter [Candidatus Hydrogenedentota bacterium]
MKISAGLRPHQRMYLAAFLLDFCVMVGLTAMPFFVYDRLHGGAAMSGAIGAAQMAAYAVGCLVSSTFVSQFRGGLKWAVSGTIVFVLLFALVPLFRTPLLCGGMSTAAFLGLALAWPALQAWIGAESDPRLRAHHLAWFNTASSFGFALSPLAAGPLYDWFMPLPFVLLAATGAAVLILVVSLPEKRRLDATRADDDARSERQGRREAGDGRLYAAWCATLTTGALAAVTRSVYPKRIEELVANRQLTLWEEGGGILDALGPATAYSWPAFVLSITMVACYFALSKAGDRGRGTALLAGTQVLAAGAFWGLGHTHSFIVMLLCFSAVGCAFGVSFFTSLYYSLADPRLGHRRAAINEGMLGFGGLAGGIALGQLAENLGFEAALHLTPLFVAAAIALQLLLLRLFRPAVDVV